MQQNNLRQGLLSDNGTNTTPVHTLSDTLTALTNAIPETEQEAEGTANSPTPVGKLIIGLDVIWTAITTANLTVAFGRVSADLFGQMFSDNITDYNIIMPTAICLQLIMNGMQTWMAARLFKKLHELYDNTKKTLSSSHNHCPARCDTPAPRVTYELIMTGLSLGLSLLAATFLAGAVSFAPDGVHLPKATSALSSIVSYCDQTYRLDIIQKLAAANMYIYLVTLGQNGCRQTLNTVWQAIPDLQQAFSIWFRFHQLICAKQVTSISNLQEKILAHHRKIHRRKQAHAKTPDSNKLRNAVIKLAITSTRAGTVSDLNTFTETVTNEYETETPATCCEKISSLLIQVPCVLSNLPWMGVMIRSEPFGPVITPVLATLALILNTKIALDFTGFLKQSFNTRSVSVAGNILDKTMLILFIAGTVLPAFPSVILGNDQRTAYCLTGKHFTLLRQDNITTYEDDSCEIVPTVFKTTFAVLGMLGVMLYLSLAASSLASCIATPLKKISNQYKNVTQLLDNLAIYQESKIKAHLKKHNDATKIGRCRILIHYSEEDLTTLQTSLENESVGSLPDPKFENLHIKICALSNDTYKDEQFTEEEIRELMQHLVNKNLSELTKRCLIHDSPNNEAMAHAFRYFYTINCLILSMPLTFLLYTAHQPTSETQLLGLENMLESFAHSFIPLIVTVLAGHIKTKNRTENNNQKTCLRLFIKPITALITYAFISLGTATIINNTLRVIGLEDLSISTYFITQYLTQNFINYRFTYSAVERLEKRSTSLPICDNQHPLWRTKCCPQVPDEEAGSLDENSEAARSRSRSNDGITDMSSDSDNYFNTGS